jgi:hypothetical protein
MQTFRSIHGKSYALSQVVLIGERRKVTFYSDMPNGKRHEREGEVVQVELVGDRTVEVEAYEVDSWGRIPISSFAAAPGTAIIHLDPSEANGHFTTPVIGWAIGSDESVYPVTADGVNDGVGDSHAVLLPTGQVLQNGGTYDSLEVWMGSMSAEAGSTATA